VWTANLYAQHFTNRFDRYIIFAGNGCSKGVPGGMRGQVLADPTDYRQLFQVGVVPEITVNWQ